MKDDTVRHLRSLACTIGAFMLVFVLMDGRMQAAGADARGGVKAGRASAPASGSFPQLNRLVKSGAAVSAIVYGLAAQKPLAVLEPDAVLTPASVTKALLAIAALDRWGASHQFRTVFASRSLPVRGVLKGDLVLLGGGDPALTNEQLWRLTTDLKRRGVERIDGDVVLQKGLFGPIALDVNRAAGQSGSRHAYDSPLSDVAVNYSVVGVFIAPGDAPGAEAAVALEPYPLPGVILRNRVQTVPAGQKTQVGVSRVSADGTELITATGEIAANAAPRTLYRSVADSDQYAAGVVRAFLESAGIRIVGKTRVQTQPNPDTSLQSLVAVEGQTLEVLMQGLLRHSNNFIADMLTIQMDEPEARPTLTAASGQSLGMPARGGKTLAGGSAQLERYVKAHLSSPVAGLVLDSGSGLTPQNKLSARSVVDLLTFAYGQDHIFPYLYGSLPAAGREGTLKRRFQSGDAQALIDRVRAKTGTLTEPVEAIGLAGYSKTDSGMWVAFAFLVNGTRVRPGFGVDRVRSAIEADLSALLRAN
jgi:D-alanyl-D-alanine carboxypeptidase/D-alanyl-D-alanine-endopeptidase (penicillin-binding protein 4)